MQNNRICREFRSETQTKIDFTSNWLSSCSLLVLSRFFVVQIIHFRADKLDVLKRLMWNLENFVEMTQVLYWCQRESFEHEFYLISDSSQDQKSFAQFQPPKFVVKAWWTSSQRRASHASISYQSNIKSDINSCFYHQRSFRNAAIHQTQMLHLWDLFCRDNSFCEFF